MKISDFLLPSDVLGELSGSSTPAVIAELCHPVAATSGVDPQLLIEPLLARERVGSTAIGEGIAVPHGKVPGLPALRASLGRSTAGIDFHSADSRPTHLFVALFSPAASPGVHLLALSRIARVFKSPSLRESLLAARDAADMYQLILSEDARS